MYHRTRRPATAEELLTIQRQSRPDVLSYGCATLMAALLCWGMAGLSGRFAGVFGHRALGWYLGLTIALLLSLHVLWLLWRLEGGQRRRARRDLDEKQVEELHVSAAPVVELEPDNAYAPMLGFQIADGELLVLRGQWLLLERTYGAPTLSADGDDARLNGLLDPHGFPNTDFVVHRLPHTGRVLAIDCRGDYLEPLRRIPYRSRSGTPDDSLLLNGSLDDLPAALEALTATGGLA